MKKKNAFTLAEVLITLGIIGVVAAITLPLLVQNYQKMVLKNQYKKSFSQFFNAIKLTQAKMGAPVSCWYWESGKSPYGNIVCQETNEYGTCKKWTMPDGSPLPSDYNGVFTGCENFYYNELFRNTLKVAKHCRSHALANGCITESYRGIDKVKAEIDPNVKVDPNSIFSDAAIKNNASAWLLTDGTLIMLNAAGSGVGPVFMIDINGHKRPNKWGYDLFTFFIRGTANDGITKIDPINYYYEEGGFSSSDMLYNAFNK